MSGALTMALCCHGRICLPLVSWRVEQSARRLVERRVANRSNDPQLQGRRANLSLVRRMLNSRAADVMTAADKCTLRQVQANTIWPKQRQADAG